MNVKCELMDHSDGKPFDNERVIVKDAYNDGDMVLITVGEKTVKVSGGEMRGAIDRCMRCSYPYI